MVSLVLVCRPLLVLVFINSSVVVVGVYVVVLLVLPTAALIVLDGGLVVAEVEVVEVVVVDVVVIRIASKSEKEQHENLCMAIMSSYTTKYPPTFVQDVS